MAANAEKFSEFSELITSLQGVDGEAFRLSTALVGILTADRNKLLAEEQTDEQVLLRLINQQGTNFADEVGVGLNLGDTLYGRTVQDNQLALQELNLLQRDRLDNTCVGCNAQLQSQLDDSLLDRTLRQQQARSQAQIIRAIAKGGGNDVKDIVDGFISGLQPRDGWVLLRTRQQMDKFLTYLQQQARLVAASETQDTLADPVSQVSTTPPP